MKTNLSRWIGYFLILCQLMGTACNSYKPIVMKTGDPKEISSLVVPGKYFKLTLKNETEILKIKVKGIDSLKLWGLASEQGEHGEQIHYKDTVWLRDVVAIKERKFDHVNVLMIGSFVTLTCIVISMFEIPF